MTDDERNLDLLALFHYVVGGLNALFSCVFLIHVGIGVAILSGALDGKGAPPRFFGWLFVVLPALLVVAGWTLSVLIIAAGRKLKRRKSHTFCLVVAGLECLLVPLGTVLGVITLVVLTKDSARQAFAAGIPPRVGR